MEPTKQEVDKAIRDTAISALKDMPVGSTVMVDNVIGYKKMGLWWRICYWWYGVTHR